MKTNIILESEIADKRISSLPTRPTAPKSYGGRGMTATEMKAAFDALPTLIIERLNELIEELGGEDVAARIETGFYEGHTLRSLINEVFTGEWATYVCANGETVAYALDFLKRNLLRVMEKLGMSPEEV
jgi:hypothetical protein